MEEIVQQILQEITPGNICVEMKVCNGTVESMEDKVKEIFKKGKRSLQEIFVLKWKFVDNGTNESIEDKVKEIFKKGNVICARYVN